MRKPDKKPKRPFFNSFWQLMSSARAYSWVLVCAITGLFITRLAEGSIYKYLIPQTLDDGFIAHKAEFLQYMPAMFLGIFCAIGLGEFLSKYCMGYVGRSVVRDYRQQMLEHLLVVPMAYYKKHTIGELISKINYDAEQVALAVSEAVREFLNSVVAIIVLFGVMLSISWKVTLVTLFVAPLVGGALRMVGKRMRRYSSRVQETMGELTHVTAEIISGYQVIKVYNGANYEKRRIHLSTDNNWRQELRTFMIAALSAPLMQLIGGTVLVGFIYMVTLDTIKLPPGQIFGLIGVMFALIRPLKQIGGVNNIFQKGLAGVESIQKLLQASPEINNGKHVLSSCAGTIRFENVSFCYPDEPDKPVLQNINFTATRGKTIAIVGKSGSGKSSLIALLPRFYNPTLGHIYIDDHDIKDIELNSLRQQIALITQHVVLFNDTIANNIAYGMPQATRQQIINAATVANALEFIQQMPLGFDTPVGENGCLLSGGQRQRIAIARAILKDAPILIMDEATSALDTESEQAIKVALDSLMRDRTTLIIAHRLSTIEKADQILVMEQGKIVESGTHAELLAAQGRYALLQRAQLTHELEEVVA
jgi:subfamily B ATP-binding cassette protein MsbA